MYPKMPKSVFKWVREPFSFFVFGDRATPPSSVHTLYSARTPLVHHSINDVRALASGTAAGRTGPTVGSCPPPGTAVELRRCCDSTRGCPDRAAAEPPVRPIPTDASSSRARPHARSSNEPLPHSTDALRPAHRYPFRKPVSRVFCISLTLPTPSSNSPFPIRQGLSQSSWPNLEGF